MKKLLMIVMVSVLVIVVAGFGYSRYTRHRAFRAQAQAAVDALVRLNEHVDDGSMWYEPADREAETQVQALSHLPASQDEGLFAMDVSTYFDMIRLQREGDQAIEATIQSEKELAGYGGKPDIKGVDAEIARQKKGADQIKACLNDLQLQLDSGKHDPHCNDDSK